MEINTIYDILNEPEDPDPASPLTLIMAPCYPPPSMSPLALNSSFPEQQPSGIATMVGKKRGRLNTHKKLNSVRNGCSEEIKRFRFKRKRLSHTAHHDKQHSLMFCPKMDVIKRFDFGRLLGEGSYGSVFDCVVLKTRQPVAIKVLKGNITPTHSIAERATSAPHNLWSGLRRAAQREIELAGAVHHKNIIELQEAIMDDFGSVYLVLEKAESSLQELLDSSAGGYLNCDAALDVASGLVGGLAALHAHGIVHRDIKMDNLLICPCDSSDNSNGTDVASLLQPSRLTLKIADLSLSRYVHSNTDPLCEDGSMTPSMSTQKMSSPELLLGSAQFGTEIDMWAAGCIIAECVCGCSVFPKASSDLEQLLSIFHTIGFPLPYHNIRTDSFPTTTTPCASSCDYDHRDHAAVWPQFFSQHQTDSSTMKLQFNCDCPLIDENGKCKQPECPYRHLPHTAIVHNASTCDNNNNNNNNMCAAACHAWGMAPLLVNSDVNAQNVKFLMRHFHSPSCGDRCCECSSTPSSCSLSPPSSCPTPTTKCAVSFANQTTIEPFDSSCPSPRCNDSGCHKRHVSVNSLPALLDVFIDDTQGTETTLAKDQQQRIITQLITRMLIYDPTSRLTARNAASLIEEAVDGSQWHD